MPSRPSCQTTTSDRHLSAMGCFQTTPSKPSAMVRYHLTPSKLIESNSRPTWRHHLLGMSSNHPCRTIRSALKKRQKSISLCHFVTFIGVWQKPTLKSLPLQAISQQAIPCVSQAVFCLEDNNLATSSACPQNFRNIL